MIDVFQICNAIAQTSTCSKCKEGGVVTDNSTGNVVSFIRSYCTCNSKSCKHQDASKCPCYVSALGDAVVQGTGCLKNTSITLVSEHYPVGYQDSYLLKLLSLCGTSSISYNRIGSKSTSANCADKKVKKKVNTSSRKKIYGTGTCPACGDQFDKVSHMQKYCNHWKIGICEVCGKVFQYKCEGKEKPKTCGSKECVHEIRRRHVMDLAKRRKSLSKKVIHEQAQDFSRFGFYD